MTKRTEYLPTALRKRQKKVASLVDLLERMRAAPLMKLHQPPGPPIYTVAGRPCSPEIAERAIAGGLLVALDRGLFDDGNAQTFEQRPC